MKLIIYIIWSNFVLINIQNIGFKNQELWSSIPTGISNKNIYSSNHSTQLYILQKCLNFCFNIKLEWMS